MMMMNNPNQMEKTRTNEVAKHHLHNQQQLQQHQRLQPPRKKRAKNRKESDVGTEIAVIDSRSVVGVMEATFVYRLIALLDYFGFVLVFYQHIITSL